MLTDNDIKEELSLAYVRAVASVAGYAVEETRRDRDSIDLNIVGRGPIGGGAVHSPVLGVQLKATVLAQNKASKKLPRTDPQSNDSFSFSLKHKNYIDLTASITLIPRILVVYVMPENRDEWVTCSDDSLILRHTAYWCSLRGLPVPNTTTRKQVRISRQQTFNASTIAMLLSKISREEPLSP
ncbi:MAG: DUF4365 domain-containing protein [Deltaproteobacteria bacterium]|nr:DUF4365 domain-containing protein [Deltaproteobacteria bacterium]